MADDPSILLWGGRSQARIVHEMIVEAGLGAVRTIYDSTLDEPAFESEAALVSDIEALVPLVGHHSHFVVCIGAHHGLARVTISRHLVGLGLRPLDLVHRTAFIEPTAVIGKGLLAMPGAVVHKFAAIGDFAIVNTGATVDHECTLGHGAHVMGAAAIAGRVTIGDFASIGTNATVLPDVRIGQGAVIGAGAVVVGDVPDNTVYAGVPARRLRDIQHAYDDEVRALSANSEGDPA